MRRKLKVRSQLLPPVMSSLHLERVEALLIRVVFVSVRCHGSIESGQAVPDPAESSPLRDLGAKHGGREFQLTKLPPAIPPKQGVSLCSRR